MEQNTAEATEQTKSRKSESLSSGDVRTDADSNSEIEKEKELEDDSVGKVSITHEATKHEFDVQQTRSLISRLEDFKQSYNRTHGQVCEFFERARVVQKLGLLESPQTSKLLSLSSDEAEDDECNSLADCNYTDGQKTTGMKRKLRKWRKVMRSALSEICPGLGLENNPDINPGLMKHIVDEVRNLKSQLAFQHTNILQLAQKTELYLQDSQQKEQFITDLLQNCKGIRFENSGVLEMANSSADNVINGATTTTEIQEEEQPPLPESLDDIQFGRSKELLNVLDLNPQDENLPNADSIVVQPQNFTEMQKSRGILIHRDSALDTNLTHLHGPEGSQHGRRGKSTYEASRGSRNVAPSSSTTAGSSQSTTRNSDLIPAPSSSNIGATQAVPAPCRCTSSSGVLASAKKRNFFMGLGGTITIAVLGTLAIGTTQRRMCDN
eukprot:g5757.t1